MTSCLVLKYISIVAFPLGVITVIKVTNVCVSPRPVVFNPDCIPVTWKALKNTHRFLSPTRSLYSTGLQWSSDVLKEASKNRGEPCLSQGAVLPRRGPWLPGCLLCLRRRAMVGAQEVTAEWRHGRAPAPPQREARGWCLCKNGLQRGLPPPPDTAGDLGQHHASQVCLALKGDGRLCWVEGDPPSPNSHPPGTSEGTFWGNRNFVDAIS